MAKNIVITGAAGQLGKSIVSELRNEGTLILIDINEEKLHKLVNELNISSYKIIKADISKHQEIINAFLFIKKEIGKIHVLINNAGVAVFTHYTMRTYDEFDKVMKVNAYGSFFCSKQALELMSMEKKCDIINIGSLYGVVSPDEKIYGNSGRNSSEVYGMSKAAIIQLTKYLSTHVPKNVRVNCISPGGIFNDQEPFFVKSYVQKTPLGRMACPEDISRVIKFLISDEINYITGQNIIVDGGFTAW